MATMGDPNEPTPIAPPHQLNSWEQQLGSGSNDVAWVVGPHAFYVFVRWIHSKRGGVLRTFTAQWFDSDERMERVMQHYGVTLPMIAKICRPYLSRLHLPPHYFPVVNLLRPLSGDPPSEEKIKDMLRQSVMGQPIAVESTARALLALTQPLQQRAEHPTRLLYAGPASTGKTETAEKVAQLLGVWDTPAFVRILGSEMRGEHDVSKVSGSAPGLVGGDVPTVYTKLQQAQSYANDIGSHCIPLVFIDELHKMNRTIQDMLREFIYTGRISSPVAGGDLDMGTGFLVIMASNWADESIRQAWMEHQQDSPHLSRGALVSLIKQAMIADELEGATIGRYGVLVPFLPLSEADTTLVLHKMVAKRMHNNVVRIPVEIDSEVLRCLYRLYYNPNFGIREVFDSHTIPMLDALLRPFLGHPHHLNLPEGGRVSISFVSDAEGNTEARARFVPPSHVQRSAAMSDCASQSVVSSYRLDSAAVSDTRTLHHSPHRQIGVLSLRCAPLAY